MAEMGDTIHYQKANASIPTSSLNHLPQAAHYLLTVLSFKRNIAINLKKLEIIFETCLNDAVEYLAPPIGVTNSNLLFRENSSGSECSCESSTSDELELEEEERRITESIDEQIKKLGNNDEDILTAND